MTLYIYIYIRNMNSLFVRLKKLLLLLYVYVYTNKYSYIITICRLLWLVYSIFFGCMNADYILCCGDFNHRMADLKDELTYWQNDLQQLQQTYKDYGYDVLDPSELSPQQQEEKALLEESITDGRKNVSESIKDIGDLWKGKNEASSSLGKREGEESESQVNKKQR